MGYACGPQGSIVLEFADNTFQEAQTFHADDLCWLALVRLVQDAKEHPQQASGTWRSIETAPKDGTEILVYGIPYGLTPSPGVHRASWRSDYPGGEAYWQCRSLGPSGEILDPTHWCPLPGPP